MNTTSHISPPQYPVLASHSTVNHALEAIEAGRDIQNIAMNILKDAAIFVPRGIATIVTLPSTFAIFMLCLVDKALKKALNQKTSLEALLTNLHQEMNYTISNAQLEDEINEILQKLEGYNHLEARVVPVKKRKASHAFKAKEERSLKLFYKKDNLVYKLFFSEWEENKTKKISELKEKYKDETKELDHLLKLYFPKDYLAHRLFFSEWEENKKKTIKELQDKYKDETAALNRLLKSYFPKADKDKILEKLGGKYPSILDELKKKYASVSLEHLEKKYTSRSSSLKKILKNLIYLPVSLSNNYSIFSDTDVIDFNNALPPNPSAAQIAPAMGASAVTTAASPGAKLYKAITAPQQAKKKRKKIIETQRYKNKALLKEICKIEYLDTLEKIYEQKQKDMEHQLNVWKQFTTLSDIHVQPNSREKIDAQTIREQANQKNQAYYRIVKTEQHVQSLSKKETARIGAIKIVTAVCNIALFFGFVSACLGSIAFLTSPAGISIAVTLGIIAGIGLTIREIKLRKEKHASLKTNLETKEISEFKKQSQNNIKLEADVHALEEEVKKLIKSNIVAPDLKKSIENILAEKLIPNNPWNLHHHTIQNSKSTRWYGTKIYAAIINRLDAAGTGALAFRIALFIGGVTITGIAATAASWLLPVAVGLIACALLYATIHGHSTRQDRKISDTKEIIKDLPEYCRINEINSKSLELRKKTLAMAKNMIWNSRKELDITGLTPAIPAAAAA